MQGVKFTPQWGASITIANAAASAAGVPLPLNADTIVLSNTSLTAIAYFRVTQYLNANDVGSGTAAVIAVDMPVLAASQIQIFVGNGHKSIRAIASAADGNLIVTPGSGV